MVNNSFFLKKMLDAKAGHKLTIGFIGGSITQGTGASAHDKCYAYRIYKWWKDNYPKTEFVYVNAGIGGTDSKFGVARVDDDLLNMNPDVVIIEFAVNDVDNPDCIETAEGLIRKILKKRKDVAVLILCNLIYDTGATMQEEYFKLAEYYKLPCISIKDTVYADIQMGRIKQSDVTADNIHPLDFGHELIAAKVIEFLESQKSSSLSGDEINTDVLPKPFTRNLYENVTRLCNVNSEPKCQGFVADMEPQSDIRDCFKKGWYGQRVGDSIEFSEVTRGVVVQYRRTVAGPAPKVKVIVDGRSICVLDGKYDQDWGDKLEIMTVAEYDNLGEHTISFVVDEADKGAVPFYLVSVIVMK